VGQFDFLGDGNAVLGDRGGAEALVEHDVAEIDYFGWLQKPEPAVQA
ncbi:TPA: hypothetical protein SG710_006583, partial [Pseudomonas aeruginosa]|nr:hypothetical protein [Pseudomonas aeruginosa]